LTFFLNLAQMDFRSAEGVGSGRGGYLGEGVRGPHIGVVFAGKGATLNGFVALDSLGGSRCVIIRFMSLEESVSISYGGCSETEVEIF
jgi:hypothetical protein